MILSKIGPETALIFRITHVKNAPWILDHGLHCRNSPTRDPNFIAIGNPELIEKRHRWKVPISPGGTLSDYVPFYFTPRSPMFLNIYTGRGVRQWPNEEIILLISSLYRLREMDIPFVFTDRHACLKLAQPSFSHDLDDLKRIDWGILQRSDFKYDSNDPEKMDRYQAEALVHRHVPIGALLGIACYNGGVKKGLESALTERHIDLQVAIRQGWYFS